MDISYLLLQNRKALREDSGTLTQPLSDVVIEVAVGVVTNGVVMVSVAITEGLFKEQGEDS